MADPQTGTSGHVPPSSGAPSGAMPEAGTPGSATSSSSNAGVGDPTGAGTGGTGLTGTMSSGTGGMQVSAAAAGANTMMSVAPNAAGAPGASSANAAGAGGDSSVSSCTPSEETCDGVDNDCDGKVDEQIQARLCGNATPPCKQGTQDCVNGTWSADCTGEIKPTEEVCDGVDNDCDGTADPGCACTNGATMECGIGIAPCRKGMRTCMDGVWGTGCPGEIKGTAEQCDGMDNDCNGSTDDGGDRLCPGQRCAGTAGCVQCLSDVDCNTRAAPACKANYCDASRHVCSTKNANDGSACGGGRTCNAGQCVACTSANDCDDRKCQNKACTGGECSYTNVRPGDSHPSCSNGKVCSASQTCISCTSPSDCDDKTCQNKSCSAAGECVYTKVSAGGTHSSCASDEVCSATQSCVDCYGAVDCEKRGAGQAWICAGGVCKIAEPTTNKCTGTQGPGCSPPCATKSDCVVAGGGPDLVACDGNSSGNWCEYSCSNSDSDCPSNMYCGTFICLFK